MTYTNLRLAREDFEIMERLGKEAGILKGTANFDDYTDTRFSEKTAGAVPWDWKGVK